MGRLRTGKLCGFCSTFIGGRLGCGRFCVARPRRRTRTFIRKVCNDANSGLRTMHYRKPRVHHGVILVAVRDVDTSFVRHFNGAGHLAPMLSSLCGRKLTFSHMCTANGHAIHKLRTMALSLPPYPNRDVVGQPGGTNVRSANTLLHRGNCGIGCFCNNGDCFSGVRAFFSNGNCSVISRQRCTPRRVAFTGV